MSPIQGKEGPTLRECREVLEIIRRLDKTTYTYQGSGGRRKIAANRDGESPPVGETWMTPREKAQDMLSRLTDEVLKRDEKRREALEKIATMDMSRWFGAKCHICGWDLAGTMDTTGPGKILGKLHAHDCPLRIAADALSDAPKDSNV